MSTHLPSPPSPAPTRPKSRRWPVALISAGVVLLLAASASAIVLTRLGQPPVTQTPTPNPTSTAPPASTPTPPPVGQWVQALTNYHVTSLAAAPGNPDVVYACVIAPGVPIEYRSVQTVLRSADFGAHWQDIGSRAQMSRDCALTINPTNSNEVYVATSSNPPADEAIPSYVLEHTSNGGDSWETIHPTVYAPGQNTVSTWQGTRLSLIGDHLYSLQAIPASPTPIPQPTPQPTPPPQGNQVLTRVITSVDGGHTWHMLDTRLAASGRSAEFYVVNLLNPAVLYELAYVPLTPGTGFPPLELYQSIDGGNQWQLLISRLPWMSPLTPATILTGSENPDAIYISNTRCPALATQAFHPGNRAALLPLAGGAYTMCMSSDGGKSWRTLAAPSQVAFSMGGGVVDRQGYLYAQATTSGAREIWRYVPATDTWNVVAQSPYDGTLLAGTSSGANGVVLWLMSANGQAVLYRYVV